MPHPEVVDVLRHRTSGRYLVVMPGRVNSAEYIAYLETPNEADATAWRTHEAAEQAHMALGSFAACWKIFPAERMMPDCVPDVQAER